VLKAAEDSITTTMSAQRAQSYLDDALDKGVVAVSGTQGLHGCMLALGRAISMARVFTAVERESSEPIYLQPIMDNLHSHAFSSSTNPWQT